MVFWKSFFLYFFEFFVKNAKNNIFEDKCFLSKMLYQIKMQPVTNWSRHQTFQFVQTVGQIFYAIFKNHIFPRFLKIISNTLKNYCMRLILCQHGRQKPTKVD